MVKKCSLHFDILFGFSFVFFLIGSVSFCSRGWAGDKLSIIKRFSQQLKACAHKYECSQDNGKIIEAIPNCGPFYIGILKYWLKPAPIEVSYKEVLDCAPSVCSKTWGDIEGLSETKQKDLEGVPHCIDQDKDKVVAHVYQGKIFQDNCPQSYNPDQIDTDSNGLGDACQEDDDSDGFLDKDDNCPKIASLNHEDDDKDGLGNSCDSCPGSIFGDLDGVCENKNIFYPKFPSLNGKMYYVSKNGSDEDGKGSIDNPWQTIVYAIGQMSDGDTVHITKGTYNECFIVNKDITIEGEDGAEIWKMGDGSDCSIMPDIDSGYTWGGKNLLIKVENSHYLRLKSINLKLGGVGPQIFVFLSNKTKLYVEDVNFHTSGTYGIAGAESEVVVVNSVFEQVWGPADIGIYLSNSKLYVDNVKFKRSSSDVTEGLGYDHCVRINGDESVAWIQNSLFEISSTSFADGIENLYGNSRVFSVHNYFLGPVEMPDYYSPRGCIHSDGTTYVLGNIFNGCTIDISHLNYSLYAAFNLFDGWLKYSYQMITSDDNADFSNFGGFLGQAPSFNFGFNLFHHVGGKEAIYSSIMKDWDDEKFKLDVKNNIWWNQPKEKMSSGYIDKFLIYDDDECIPIPNVVECPILKAIEFEPVSTVSPPKDFDGMQYPEYITKELGVCEFKEAIFGMQAPPTTNLKNCMADVDNDGFPLLIDNCPLTPSDSLNDSDLDGIGDVCDDS